MDFCSFGDYKEDTYPLVPAIFEHMVHKAVVFVSLFCLVCVNWTLTSFYKYYQILTSSDNDGAWLKSIMQLFHTWYY